MQVNKMEERGKMLTGMSLIFRVVGEKLKVIGELIGWQSESPTSLSEVELWRGVSEALE